MILQVSASVEAAGRAFDTGFSYYQLDKPRLSADSNPSLPANIAGMVLAIDGLTDSPVYPAAHSLPGAPPKSESNAGLAPDIVLNGNNFVLPNDFAQIYDIGSVYSRGNTGATIGSKPQHIAVIDRSDVAAADVADFAAKAGISTYTFNTIQAGTSDPGQTADDAQLESTLDVQRTIGTAPGATTDLIVAPLKGGDIFAAASYNVNTLVDPVMTISFYGCEASHGASGVNAWDTLFSTAAAEGISTFVCSGDSEAAGCANDFSNPPATTPVRSVNYICSSSYATCVGGTEFNDTANTSTYWASTNGSGGKNALSYIPEGAWNEPTSTSTSSGFQIAGTGGGASVYVAKPSWQMGNGVPSDGQRDQPDLAFTSAAHDGYYGCLSYGGRKPCSAGYYFFLYGTSAAAPSMAGIAALLNTRAGKPMGNLNPLLYQLAATVPAAFHDVTVASSGVTNCSTMVASMCNNSTPSMSGLTGGLAGYPVTAGYDQTTGLGSLDVANFLAAAVPTSTTIALGLSSSTPSAGQAVTITATLTPSRASVATPSGTVQFFVGSAALGSPVTLSDDTASTTFTAMNVGTYMITAKYSGDIYYTAAASSAVTITAATGITLSAANNALQFTSGATSGNSNTINVSSTYGFAGTVAFSCNMTSSTAAFQPSCSVSPASVSLASGATGTAAVTIASTTATAFVENPTPWLNSHSSLAMLGFGGFLLVGLCSRKRRTVWLGALGQVSLSLGLQGCSGKSAATPNPTPLRSSAGAYTVTVTAAGTPSGSTSPVTATTSFAVTIQ